MRCHPLYGNITYIGARSYSEGPFAYKGMHHTLFVITTISLYILLPIGTIHKVCGITWWRNGMHILSGLPVLCGEFTNCQWILSINTVMQNFALFLFARIRFYKLSNGRWNETPQCSSAVPFTTRSIFSTILTIENTVRCRYNSANFSINLTTNAPWLAREGEVWGVFCDLKLFLCSAGVIAFL